jgi:hypothetical protein
MDETDDPQAELPDAARLEADWEHALDAAGKAVDAGTRGHSLDSAEASAEHARIDSERKWLQGFRPSLRKLFPRRSR